MLSVLRSKVTKFLADALCKGSVRKLISGWWYAIIVLSLLLIIMSFVTLTTRESAEGFTSAWGSITLIAICVGGTMVMRKYHDSFFVGLFMGCLAAGSQFFLMLYLLLISYAREREVKGNTSHNEHVQSFFCIVQSILLGSFAIVLGAHRDDIIESKVQDGHDTGRVDGKEDSYNPPSIYNA